ncbi:hypothetical protein TSOC_009054 [Tetrabaena socialis]|uniref:Uncharacterized protein n=1 Tax=Tetrabaena socialis TaxID=47790 RepID=A0A2J7ZWV0_9CHLO|nr:hypothetical protein TSOC_009054 [Tetrabaena socialis]|eukprot:PNH04757.1 hypothetical protein TSOC_009054 [Tetrabaena socialis]
MVKTIGRRVVDVAQKARGRLALRYEIEIIPYFCGEIPEGVKQCSFAWERGSKLFVTNPEAVNPNTRAVFWKQYLRQTVTIYKEGTELLQKDFAFKVQDLSGFDPETGEPLHNGHNGHQRSRNGGGASTSGGGGDEDPDDYGNPYPGRKGKKHRRRKHRTRTHSENGIPEDAEQPERGQDEGHREPHDPGHDPGGAEEGGGRRGRKGERRAVLQVYGGAGGGKDGTGGGGSGALQVQAGRQLHKSSWRDYVCCCCPPRGPAEDPLEGDTLLAKGRVG